MMGIMMKKDKHKKILLALIVVVLIALGIFWACYLEDKKIVERELSIQNEIIWSVNNETDISLEIADTPQKRYLGLSNRNDLCADCGMLFVSEDMRDHSFVMRNMNFPLDILFIRDNTVVKLYENLPPEGSAPQNIYSSGEPVNYVLELNGGKASELGLRKGSEINLPFEDIE